MSGRVDLSDDAFLGGRLRLLQLRQGHRAGHDAMLLAAATPFAAGDRVVDLGAGVGAAGLAVASRQSGARLALVDRDPALVALARDNAARNGIAATVIELDVAARAENFAAAGLGPDSADRVLMNPPFNHPQRHQASPDEQRRAAHRAEEATLATWIHAARRLLKPGGTLSLIWRADGLAEVLVALDRGFGGVCLLPVHATASAAAIRVLVRATKGARAPLACYRGIVLSGQAGQAPAEIEEVLRGTRLLPLAQL